MQAQQKKPVTQPNDEFMGQQVTLDGTTKSVAIWCKEKKLKPNTVYGRRNSGCSWAEALRPLSRHKSFRQYGVRMNDQSKVMIS